MSKCLGSIFETGSSDSCNRGTLHALERRGMVDRQGRLTEEGLIRVLSRRPLGKQCEVLGLPLEDLTLEWADEPEHAAYEHFRALGYRGGCCEDPAP